MPLSEHEQRLLEEMERNLYHNDADFVAAVGTRRGKPNYTLIVVGVLTAVLGLAVIVTGVVIQLAFVGIIGFVVLLGGVLLAISPPRSGSIPQEASAAERAGEPRPSAAAGPSRSGFMERMNERWDKRQDGRDERD